MANTDFEVYWGVPLEIKWANLDVTASGDVIAAVTGKKLLVVSMALWARDASGSGSFKFQSGGSTDLTPAFTVDTTFRPQYQVLDWNPAGWLITAAGEKLNVVLSSMNSLQGLFQYVEVN